MGTAVRESLSEAEIERLADRLEAITDPEANYSTQRLKGNRIFEGEISCT